MLTEATEIPAVVETPASEVIADTATEKVTFDARQQLRVNELIKFSQSRAARDLRAEVKTLRENAEVKAQELELYKNSVSPELAAANESLSVQITARQQAEARESKALLMIATREALSNEGVFAIADATALLLPELVYKDNLAQGADGRTLAEHAADFVNSRPHFVKGSVRPGLGSFESQSNAPVTPDLTRLFGPGSNGDDCNRLARSDPRRYKTLRAAAVKAGLVR